MKTRSPLRRFVILLRLEALVCLALGGCIAFAPELLIRILFQAPVGSRVAGFDAVLFVRAAGWAVIGLGLFHAAVSLMIWRVEPIALMACAARVAFGVARACVLLKLPLLLPIFGLVELVLAAWTVIELVRMLAPMPAPRLPPMKQPVARWKKAALAAAAALALLLVWTGDDLVEDLVRVPRFESDEEQFKHGTHDVPWMPGLPLHIFEALPKAFPDKLPGGWESLGFIFEPGHAAPVGFAERKLVVPVITANCALCHGATYRTEPGGPATFIPLAPAATLDFHGFIKFIFAAGADPKFTDGTLLREIRRDHKLNAAEAALYEHVLLPVLAEALKVAPHDFKWMSRLPEPGPGRMDAGGLLKFNMLRLRDDDTIATSDYRALWNQRAGYTNAHRWSGGGVKLDQENMLAGALFHVLEPAFLDFKAYRRTTNYFAQTQPPRFPGAVDAGLVTRGREVFRRA